MEIIWTKSAQVSLISILKFIGEKFGKKIAKGSYERICHKVALLLVAPEMGKLYYQESGKQDVRCLLADKHCKVFYVVSEQEKIHIIFVWDVRQNPEVLNYLLSTLLL